MKIVYYLLFGLTLFLPSVALAETATYTGKFYLSTQGIYYRQATLNGKVYVDGPKDIQLASNIPVECPNCRPIPGGGFFKPRNPQQPRNPRQPQPSQPDLPDNPDDEETPLPPQNPGNPKPKGPNANPFGEDLPDFDDEKPKTPPKPAGPTEAEILQGQLDALKKANEELAKQREALNAQLGLLNEEKKGLTSKADALSIDVSNLKKELDKSTKENKAKIDELTQRFDATIVTLNKVNELLKAKDEEIASLNKKLKSIGEINENLSEENLTLDEQNANLAKTNAQLSTENKELESSTDTLAVQRTSLGVTASILGIGALSLAGVALYFWKRTRPVIKEAMDKIEDVAQAAVSKVAGQEFAQEVRDLIDESETRLGDLIERKIEQLAAASGTRPEVKETIVVHTPSPKLERTIEKAEKAATDVNLSDPYLRLETKMSAIEQMLNDMSKKKLADSPAKEQVSYNRDFFSNWASGRANLNIDIIYANIYKDALNKLKQGEIGGKKELADTIEGWVRKEVLSRGQTTNADHQQAYAGVKYQEAIGKLRNGDLGFEKETADNLENWATKEFANKTGLII